MINKKIMSVARRPGGLLLCCLPVLFSCGAGGGGAHLYNTPDAETVTIGAVYPASLWDKDYYMRDALELAVKQVNESGGVLGKPLDMVIRDDQGDSRIAQQIAETFSGAGITAVVGHWSSDVCYYVEDIYEERKIVMITPSAVSGLLFEYDYQYIYRMITNNRLYAEALADYAERQGIGVFAVYYSEDAYGLDLAQAAERELSRRRIPVADRITSISPANVDVILDRWRAFNCGGLLLASSFPDIFEPVKLIRNSGTDIPVFSEAFNYTDFETVMAGYLKNYYVIMYDFEDMDPAFLAAFRGQYGRDPDTYEVAGYEAVRLLADAMNAGGSTKSAAIVRYLRNLKDYPTVMGRASYNPVTREFDGRRMRVRPYTYAAEDRDGPWRE
ncbi:MAG: ABC transporter substrate-binding protein [Treponema sp.]|nr:ABC transporter substrate-binding protein [Treponema sp.]